jgi:hypothetical protein
MNIIPLLEVHIKGKNDCLGKYGLKLKSILAFLEKLSYIIPSFFIDDHNRVENNALWFLKQPKGKGKGKGMSGLQCIFH